MILRYSKKRSSSSFLTLPLFQSGNIAQHLGLVQHHVRTKLDEAKQREMARLRDLVGQKIRNLSGMNFPNTYGRIICWYYRETTNGTCWRRC
jgi:hypothetical protein